ncbi:MAG: hypothetical protein H0W82_07010 [Actinobacteria bacterium]|nr:hypothetical protein [Actinomycetota bacterium]
MPTEIAKGAERCETHPGSASVAHCARCGRTLCIACAIPVRGDVLGAECLPPDVAADAPVEPVGREPMPRWWAVTGIALATLMGATAFPWTRFGVGSGSFGAWGPPARWSLVAAVAGAIASLLWVALRHPGRGASAIVVVLSIGAGVGAGLAILNPPPFTRATFAPWMAVAAASIAACAAVAVVRRPSG